MKPPLCIWFLTFSLAYQTVYAQPDSSFLLRAASSLSNQPVHEHVYLHLDKPNYSFGDTIWFKAYTVIGRHHQLSGLSKVLYAELISPADSVVTRQILPLASGVTWSDIPLARTLKPGVYRLRAYTRWMRNFGSGSFYEQRITIGGTPPVIAQHSTKEHPDVQFFPEGGQMVIGVRCRVAVKAVGPNGLGVDIKGVIKDNTGNIAADFATQHLGMGVFAFVPMAGKKYHAQVLAPGETSFNVNLPAALSEGYTLAVNDLDKDSIYVRVAVNDKTLKSNHDKRFGIIAQSNGKVLYTTEAGLDHTVYTASIPKKRFPEGIAQFTLFSQSGEPLAERLAFIDNGNGELRLNLKPFLKSDYEKGKMKFELSTTDDSNKTAPGTFSVAVINESLVKPDSNAEQTILTGLLLTPELKGYIEQPGYYFAYRTTKTHADLDVLMLTQGYRRYDWKRILDTAQQPLKYLPEKAPEIAGRLTTPRGKAVAGGKVTLMDIRDGILRDTITDTAGDFRFTGLVIADTATLVLKAKKQNNSDNVKIVPELPEYPAIEPENYPYGTDTLVNRQQYDAYQKVQTEYIDRNGKLLKTVVVKAHKIPPKPDLSNSSNLNGPGHANQVVMYNQLSGCVVLSECLNGLLFGVRFSKPDIEGKSIPYSERMTGRLNGQLPMTLIVDGITMDASHLDELNPKDVYSIEVLRSGTYLAIYGSSAAGGALVITTKRGGEGADYIEREPSGIVTIPYLGFYKSRSFYVPKYRRQNDKVRDTRNTVYWDPNILTGKDGKASLEYFNNDTKGVYRIIIEGINDDGNIGRTVYRYTVK
ncbi:MAG TPA: TonB-dependent receptor plug domain-containing protein [Mucilaginibacter sp.]|nr:TonB-dependent receptor plug domain-containing protein [Mucilaginibacter sp.]